MSATHLRPRALRAAAALAGVLAAWPSAAQPARASAPTELLPNLVARPTLALYVGTPDSVFVDSANEPVFGCQPSEVVEQSARRCLRFQTIVANFGSGPLELRLRADQATGGRTVQQRVYRSDGTYADRPAGSYDIDPSHGHIHSASAFATASLWTSDRDGHRVGSTPLRTSSKAAFCLQDVIDYYGRTPAHYTGTASGTVRSSCYPDTVSPSGEVAQVNGISVGWGDIYNTSIPSQYLEISGIPDGYYLLRIEVDPRRQLREVTRKDNVSWQRIRICGRSADLVGKTAACDRT